MSDPLASLKAAMEILPDGIIIVDSEHVIVGCNNRAERLFGYQDGELIDQPLSKLLPPGEREAHARKLADYDPKRGFRAMEERPVLSGYSKAGKRLPLSIGISVIETPDQRYFVAVVRDARSFDDTLEEAISLADLDPLTQLGNRRYLSAKLADCEADAIERPIALLFIDLDRFKPLNDTYGHEVGDEVLSIVARRLRRGLRERDVCIRLGGDEFVVIVANIAEKQALEAVARKLHNTLTMPMRVRDKTVEVGASIGGVIGSPKRVRTETLLERADAAMYQAKANGMSYCYYDEEASQAA